MDFDMLDEDAIGISKDPANANRFESAIGFTPITWPVGTGLRLCNVPWDSSYANVVYFDSAGAKDSYFDSLAGSTTPYETTEVLYCLPNAPVKIDLPYYKAYTYNYLVVSNPSLNDATAAGTINVEDVENPPVFYYFIVDVQYLAPNTTQLTLQLDVFMTYQYNASGTAGFEIGRAFVERGHIALHSYKNNSNLTTQQKKRRYLLQPEGLNVGSDYQTINEKIWGVGGVYEWVIIVTSTVRLNGNWGTVSDPKMQTARGMKVDGFVSGCVVYGMTTDNFIEFMKGISSYPWISNNIVSITAMPEGTILHGDSVKLEMQELASDGETYTGTVYTTNMFEIKGQYKNLDTQYHSTNLNNFLNGNDVDDSDDTEGEVAVTAVWQRHPKAKCYPYSYLHMDNMCGTPLLMKPELFNSNTIEWVRMSTVVPPFQRIFVFPKFYNSISATTKTTTRYDFTASQVTQNIPQGDLFNNALIWGDFPTFSIVNNNYFYYLASNANSLQFRRDNAGWVLEKSNAYANLSYDNSMRTLQAQAANQAASYSYQMNAAQNTLNGYTQSTITDLASQLPSGSTGSASGASFTEGIATGLMNVASNASNLLGTTAYYASGQAAAALGQQQFDTSYRAATANAGANQALSLWANKGDYQQTIASIEATVQDAALTPPNQSGVLGGGMQAILASWGLNNCYLFAKTLYPEYQRVIGGYWDRFGYAVNEFVSIGTSFNLMSKLTYWKLQDVTIECGYADETARSVLKGIFEKGVSIFSSPDYVAAAPYNENGTGVLETNSAKTSTALY